MPINYNEEVKKLDSFVPNSNSKFWKPKAGQYKVKALNDLEDTDPYVPKDSKNPEKDTKPQVKLDLLVGDDKVTWTLAKGISPASTYGQLCKLALQLGGTLKDKEFLVVVTSDNKKNTYTIVKL